LQQVARQTLQIDDRGELWWGMQRGEGKRDVRDRGRTTER
jgi:hypothetical protein